MIPNSFETSRRQCVALMREIASLSKKRDKNSQSFDVSSLNKKIIILKALVANTAINFQDDTNVARLKQEAYDCLAGVESPTTVLDLNSDSITPSLKIKAAKVLKTIANGLFLDVKDYRILKISGFRKDGHLYETVYFQAVLTHHNSTIYALTEQHISETESTFYFHLDPKGFDNQNLYFTKGFTWLEVLKFIREYARCQGELIPAPYEDFVESTGMAKGFVKSELVKHALKLTCHNSVIKNNQINVYSLKLIENIASLLENFGIQALEKKITFTPYDTHILLEISLTDRDKDTLSLLKPNAFKRLDNLLSFKFTDLVL
jgi:hypothetical protein